MSSAVLPATNQARCSHGVRRAWYRINSVHDLSSAGTPARSLGTRLDVSAFRTDEPGTQHTCAEHALLLRTDTREHKERSPRLVDRIHMQWTTGTAEAANCGTGLAVAVASGLCHPATECLRNCHGWPMALGGRTGHIAPSEECACATRPPCHILLVKLEVGSTCPDKLGNIWGQLVPEALNQLVDWHRQAVPALIWFGIPGAPAPRLHRALVCHPA